MRNRPLHIALFVCIFSISIQSFGLQSPKLTAAADKHAPNKSHSQSAASPLYQTIADLDKQLFDAVDRCDMDKVNSFWADDVEFYHDKDGLTVGREKIVSSIKNNLYRWPRENRQQHQEQSLP